MDSTGTAAYNIRLAARIDFGAVLVLSRSAFVRGMIPAGVSSAESNGASRVRRLGYYLVIMSALAGLAILTYLPFLRLPPIADDYVQISLARAYGPVSGWASLVADPLYRCRATSLILTYWTERLFGIGPAAINWSSVLLHILNVWLVLALGVWRPVGWRISALAAAFFAVYEGHQEAVVWYSALPELLVFFFSVLCLLFWILWLQSSEASHGYYYPAAILSFLLALASKESAVAVAPLLLVPLAFEWSRWKRRLVWTVPFAALACVYAALIFASRSRHLHFNDAGTFSLQAPFALTWSISLFRLLWFWGLLSLLVLGIARDRNRRRLLLLAFAWIGITLLPYSFLKYMPRVPSRHTYFASAGLSLVVAAGFLCVRERLGVSRRWAAYAVAAVVVLHNGGYLWTRKYAQYVERAAPTEALIRMARQTRGPIYMHCFPYDPSVATLAVEIETGRPGKSLLWDSAAARSKQVATVFCWDDWRARLHPGTAQ